MNPLRDASEAELLGLLRRIVQALRSQDAVTAQERLEVLELEAEAVRLDLLRARCDPTGQDG